MIVQSRVHSINANAVFNGFHHHPFHIVFARNFFKRLKKNGMETNNQIELFVDGFLHHCFGNIMGDQNATTRPCMFSDQQSYIVKIFSIG